MCYRLFGSIIGLYLLDAINMPSQVVTTKNVSKFCHMSPVGQIALPSSGPINRFRGQWTPIMCQTLLSNLSLLSNFIFTQSYEVLLLPLSYI